MNLDDIEAALWYRFPGATVADVEDLLAMVTVYASTGRDITAARRAELAAATKATKAGGDRPAVLRAAHAEASRLRENGCPVPTSLADLDREYEREKKRTRRIRSTTRLASAA